MGQSAVTPTQGFTFGAWGFWGWAETVIKLVAVVIGVIAFLGIASAAPFVIGGNPELGAVILLGLLTIISVVVIFGRLAAREIVSIAFAIASAIGHITLWIALARVTTQPELVILFAVFIILGNLAKARFLTVSGYTEMGQDTAGMLRFNWGLIAIYGLLAIMIVI